MAIATLTGMADAATYYVQPGASGDGSSTKPWGTIADANASVRAGDTVILESGEYAADPIAPQTSGREGIYITYRAAAGAKPVITNISTAIVLDGRSWIRIDGVAVDGKYSYPESNVKTWISMNDSHHNIIENSTFRRARGWAGVVMHGGASFNTLRANRFDELGTPDTGPDAKSPNDDSGDILYMIDAVQNLIEQNEFFRGGHNLFDVRGHYNVLRRNLFDNNWGSGTGNRIGELSAKSGSYASLHGFNVFEWNIVRGARAAADNPTPPAIKVQGQGQIVRRNYFFDNISTAILSEVRNPPIEQVTRNRIYHNNFDQVGGIWTFRDYTEGPSDGNIFKNNAVGQLTKSPTFHIALNESVLPGNDHYNGNQIISNIFSSDSVTVRTHKETLDLVDAGQVYPATFAENIAAEISVTNDAPKAGSPLIDGAAPLTYVASPSGQASSVVVEDAGYFTDGFGVIAGDRIRIGNNDPAQIVAVDYSSNTLSLDRAVAWQQGDPVNLDYVGRAPDIGSHESGFATAPVPKPPRMRDN